MALSFPHLWNSPEHADLEVLLQIPDQLLASFPGHSALMSSSPFLSANILRWQNEPAAKRRRTGDVQDSSSTDASNRRQLVLDLQDASEKTAALTVLKSLYAVEPLPELLSGLTHEQQLQAALLADMWQVPHVSTAAARLLEDAVNADGGLSDTVKQRVLSAQALPDCLQPLLQSVLLSTFGDLEAVWADAGLQRQLLELPLPAMELLLACSELQVATEDTVLYTVQQYVQHTSPDQQQHARQQLAPLVRCQHISQFLLALAVASAAANEHVLAGLRPQLSNLLLMRTGVPGCTVRPVQVEHGLKGAPDSWLLERRVHRSVESVSVVWNVSIKTLREEAQRSFAEQKLVKIHSPVATPPFGGLTYTLYIQARPQGDSGCVLGLFAVCNNLPEGASHSVRFKFKAGPRHVDSGRCETPSRQAGLRNFFRLGVMSGGWDQTKWAANWFPVTGDMDITLTVSEVGHMLAAPAQAGGRGGRRGR